MSKLSIVILTHNEALHIGRALSAVKDLRADVVIVDSGSSDGTVEIAQRLGARIFTNGWVNYATQFQWALDNTNITSEWVMRLDADEILRPDLVEKLSLELPLLSPEITGVVLNRKHVFLGKWIRHGGRFPLYLLRIWRKGAAHIENRWMDEHMVLDHGQALRIEGGFEDVNLGNLSFFIDKHNKYATREAVDVVLQKLGLVLSGAENIEHLSGQAKTKRWIKKNIYNQLPIGIGPLAYFIYRYVFSLGFLDGGEGLIYHSLQGLWYRFLVQAKVGEIERELNGSKSHDESIKIISEITGLAIK